MKLIQRNRMPNVFFILTHRCNLRCKYCFVNKETLDMTPEIAFNAIDYLAQLNGPDILIRITFFGGEPMLKWKDIIVPSVFYAESKYPEHKFKFSITTNCTLLTETRIKFLKKHKISILTSIDGAPETQDYNRPYANGLPSSEKVEKNIKLLLKSNITSAFRATIYPDTCHLTLDNYLYAKDLGYTTFYGIPDTYSEWNEEQSKILYDSHLKMANHWIEYWKEHKQPFLSIRSIENFYEDILLNVQRKKQNLPLLNKIEHKKCAYGRNFGNAIDPKGNIYTCQQATSLDPIFCVGNIYDGIDNEQRLLLMKQYDDELIKKGDILCEDCSAKSACDGGCLTNNYAQTGLFRQCSHGYCETTRILFSIANYVYEQLKDDIEFIQYMYKQANIYSECNNCQNLENIDTIEIGEKN